MSSLHGTGDGEFEKRSGVGIARKALWDGPKCQGTGKARRSRRGLRGVGPSARGLVRHVGRGGGSAGSVLRSQGTLGPAKLSRYRARGIRMSTFLCSLRPGPAAALWIGCSMRKSDSRRFGMRHRFSEEGLQDLGPSARGLVRHVGRGGGLRGIGPALAGNVGAGWAFALSREGDQDVDVPMLAADRSRCRPGRPTESVTFPKADPSQRVGTGFLAAFLSARGFVGTRNSDPHPDNGPWTTTGPRITCNLER